MTAKIKQIIKPTKKEGYLKIWIKDKDNYDLWIEEVMFVGLMEDSDGRETITYLSDIIYTDHYEEVSEYDEQVVCKISLENGLFSDSFLRTQYKNKIEKMIEREMKKREEHNNKNKLEAKGS